MIKLGAVLLAGIISTDSSAQHLLPRNPTSSMHRIISECNELRTLFDNTPGLYDRAVTWAQLFCSLDESRHAVQIREERLLYAAAYNERIFFTLADAAISPPGGFAPGTVVLSIRTFGVKKWFATNTVALFTQTGTACVVDAGPEAPSSIQNAEVTTYSVVDGTHVRLSLKKPHVNGATLLVGGGCQFEPDAAL